MRIVHPRLFKIGACLLAIAAVTMITGCAGGAFLNDLENVLPIVLLALPGITAIAGSVEAANPQVAAEITTILARVTQNVTAANELVQQYKKDSSETTLQQIEDLIPTIQSDLDTLPAIGGVPPAEAEKIKAITDTIVPELEALLSSLPIFKASTAGQTFMVTKPQPSSQFKSKVQSISAG
jgi:hypothetical protein